MQLITYLSFDGDCAEAFRFYEKALGGKIEMLMPFADSPMADQVGPDWQDRVMHARLITGGAVLMGGDSPPGSYAGAEGFCVNVMADTAAEAERIFNALAEGGKVTMPLGRTFWAESFGMLVDRFGIPWMVNGPQL